MASTFAIVLLVVAVLLLCSSVFPVSVCGQSTPGPVVQTESGKVAGYVNNNVNIFQGIPFAAPPTGDYRFKPPQPASPWQGVRQSVAGAICPQIGQDGLSYVGSEDCLYLDVYTPNNASAAASASGAAALLPVFFWIYGGAFLTGDKFRFGLYNATNLVQEHGYIVVAANYRLGALGFFTSDELRLENGDGSAGNLGLRDQRFALQWVQRNIAAFGGDSKRVTLVGESAGAFSGCYHLASRASFGLFAGVIMESASCGNNIVFFSYGNSKAFSLAYAEMIGCNHTQIQGDAFLKCLRALNVNQIIGPVSGPGKLPLDAAFQPIMYPSLPWGATIDSSNQGLYQLPLQAIQQGNWANVPLLAGTNQDEGTLFMSSMVSVVPGVSLPFSNDNLLSILLHLLSNNQTLVESVLQQYPEYAYVNATDRTAKIFRDYFFACPTRRAVLAVADKGQLSWLYHFIYLGQYMTDAALGVFHSYELFFMFDNGHLNGGSYSKQDQVMANSFGDYWSNFLWTSNPNGNQYHQENRSENVYWPTTNAHTLANVVLNVPTAVEDNYLTGQCDFWDAVDSTIVASVISAPTMIASDSVANVSLSDTAIVMAAIMYCFVVWSIEFVFELELSQFNLIY